MNGFATPWVMVVATELEPARIVAVVAPMPELAEPLRLVDAGKTGAGGATRY